MTLNESIPIISNFFQLTYIENSGIAFGMFSGGSVIFTVAAIIATVLVIWYLWKVRNGRFSLKLSLAIILGGAIGNLIDRLLFGKVVDFLDFSIAGLHWPVFNVADSSVTIGIFLFIYLTLFKTSDLKKNSI